MTIQAQRFAAFSHLVSTTDVLDAAALNVLRTETSRPAQLPFMSCFRELLIVDAQIDARQTA